MTYDKYGKGGGERRGEGVTERWVVRMMGPNRKERQARRVMARKQARRQG